MLPTDAVDKPLAGANPHLAEGNYSATEIAFMLGFSDISTFSRAYKQWSGVSPAAELFAKG